MSRSGENAKAPSPLHRPLPSRALPSPASSPPSPMMGGHLCWKRSCSFLSEDAGSGGRAGKGRHKGLPASGVGGMGTQTKWAGEQ